MKKCQKLKIGPRNFQFDCHFRIPHQILHIRAKELALAVLLYKLDPYHGHTYAVDMIKHIL